MCAIAVCIKLSSVAARLSIKRWIASGCGLGGDQGATVHGDDFVRLAFGDAMDERSASLMRVCQPSPPALK